MQKFGCFPLGKLIQPEQGYVLRMLLAKVPEALLHVVHEHGVILKAGNGMVGNTCPKEFPSEDGGQPSELAGKFKEMPNDRQGLAAIANRFRRGIRFGLRLGLRMRTA